MSDKAKGFDFILIEDQCDVSTVGEERSKGLRWIAYSRLATLMVSSPSLKSPVT